MIVPIYVLMQPGADRPYVTTFMPSEECQKKPGTKLFCVMADLPGFSKIDGVVQAEAIELPLSTQEKHV